MSLKDLKVATEIVTFPGGEMSVRGLSLPDVTLLVVKQGPALRSVFEEVIQGKDDADFSMEVIAIKIATAARDLPGYVIACAADEPDEWEQASKLPFPVQVEALERIGRLTFATEDGLKNFVETVIRVANGISGSASALQLPSTTGIEESEPA